MRGKGGGGRAWQGGMEACMAGELATAADGSHPTGMHSHCNTDEIKKKV